MFFRSHKPERPDPFQPAIRQDDPVAPSLDQLANGADEAELERRRLYDQWRHCEQRVTRAWRAWQAADRSDDGRCYRVLIAALADEERAAAEVQRRTVGSPG